MTRTMGGWSGWDRGTLSAAGAHFTPHSASVTWGCTVLLWGSRTPRSKSITKTMTVSITGVTTLGWPHMLRTSGTGGSRPTTSLGTRECTGTIEATSGEQRSG